MLNVQQTAVLLGLAEHDIPVLLNAGFLKALGEPQPNAVRYFASVQVLELAGEIAVEQHPPRGFRILARQKRGQTQR